MSARTSTRQHSVAEVAGFVDMLRAACENPSMHRTLTTLLEQPDERRQDMVRWLVARLESDRAPAKLVQAIACLVDDAVAEKAYVVIHECQR
jgi:hypothetical protein